LFALQAEDREMTDCALAELSGRGVLRVRGEGARAFLQGLITNDVDRLGPGEALHAGLLSPQGKILFEFFVLQDGDGFLLECPKESVAPLRQRLVFYRLRAKLDIEEAPDLKVAAAWGGKPRVPNGSVLFADPRLEALGYRIVLPSEADLRGFGCTIADEADYHAFRIGLCVPEGGLDYAYGDAFPHEALFDQLNGVDFRKGCFVGQEVVSRMEHRGTARKRIVGISAEGPLPEPRTPITADGHEIGTMGSSHGHQGLALIRLDRAEDARERSEPMLSRGTRISLRIPAWAHFPQPKAGEP
jgi:folate-binding protein YgfZ